MAKHAKRFLSLVLVLSMMVALLPMMVSAQTPSSIIITNPYENVNWETFGRYRAALHTHTTHSDGMNTVAETVLDHFNKGFDILAITDHSVTNSGDWTVGEGALTQAQVDAVIDGTYDGSFPGLFGPERRRVQENGMIGISFTNEQSYVEHIVTLWANFNNERHYTTETVLQRTTEVGGLAFIGHPGRYTGGMAGGALGANASNNRAVIANYLEIFQTFDSAIGMEIFNSLDNETASDRILWDNLLSRTMRYGLPIWGFANDDSHNLNNTGFNWNTMLLPELTEANTREAMEQGAFYAVTRVDRRLAINSGGNRPVQGTANDLVLLEQPTPSISSIVVEGNTITIDANDYETIQWIANGEVVYEGATIDILDLWDEIGYYVRAQIISETGVAMTQPFGVRAYGEAVPSLPANDAYEIIEVNPRTLRNGAEATVEGFLLPRNIVVETARGWHVSTPVSWNLDDINYDPSITDEAQSFVVSGVVELPANVSNELGLDLTTQVNITVNEYRVIEVMPIRDVQLDDSLEEVTVQGIVTGFYEVNLGNDNAFFIRDGSGTFDSILVRLEGDLEERGARFFVGMEVEVTGIRALGAGNGFAGMTQILVTDTMVDIWIVDESPEFPTPTLRELTDLIPTLIDSAFSFEYINQLVSIERVLVSNFRTGPAMPRSNILLGNPETGQPLAFDPETGALVDFDENGDVIEIPPTSTDFITFAINFASDYEALGAERPSYNPNGEAVWITIESANTHWWAGRNEFQIRLTEPVDWDDVMIDAPSIDTQVVETEEVVDEEVTNEEVIVYRPVVLPFTDVDINVWYRQGIAIVFGEGIMMGTSSTTFSPDAPLTRAMMATVLWRLSGRPDTAEVDTTGASRFYSQAVAWAVETSLLCGDDLDNLHLAVTLEELAQALDFFNIAGQHAVIEWARDLSLNDVVTRAHAAAVLAMLV